MLNDLQRASACEALIDIVLFGDVKAAITLLDRLLPDIEASGIVEATVSQREAAVHATRLSAAVLQLLLCWSAHLDAVERRRLLLAKRTIDDLLGASEHPTAALVARLRARNTPAGANAAISEARAAVLMLVAPVSLVPSLDSDLMALDAESRLLHCTAWLSDPICLTPAQQAGRDWLIDHAGTLLDADRFPARFGARIASAWMFCSYADHPDRHAVKRVLNRTIGRWLHGAGVRPPPGRALPRVPEPLTAAHSAEPSPGPCEAGAAPESVAASPAEAPTLPVADPRPVILVVAERFLAHHAMHRVYAPSIRQLRRDFRVILVATPDQIDAAGEALADEVWPADRDLHKLPALVARIARLAPDAIFYPSVGMSMWAIALANLRLAPVQLMSIGHPASSFSPVMDYMVLGRDVLGDPGCFSEKVIVRDAPGNPIQPPPGAWGPAPAPRARPQRLEIAVPAMAAKVSPAFLEACRALTAQAGRPVRFHFFPNRQGIGHRHFEALVLRALPGSIVRPPTNYTRYMAWLAECDLALATFPFGNANSTVDCLLLGKPVVALEGDEPAARTDRRMLRLAGAPPWLLATSRAQYFDTALRLVRDDALRVETARAILAADPATALFERERTAYPDDFADVVSWLLRNHATIRADGRKVWWPEDRRGGAPASRETPLGAGPVDHGM